MKSLNSNSTVALPGALACHSFDNVVLRMYCNSEHEGPRGDVGTNYQEFFNLGASVKQDAKVDKIKQRRKNCVSQHER